MRMAMFPEADPKQIFGRRLRAFRLSMGLSQEALASSAGLDRTYVSGCERGQRNISLENIYKLSVALDISPAELFKDPADEILSMGSGNGSQQ